MANLKQTIIDGNLLVSETLHVKEVTSNLSRIDLLSQKAEVQIGQYANNINLFSSNNVSSSLTLVGDDDRDGPQCRFISNATSNNTVLGKIDFLSQQDNLRSDIVSKGKIRFDYLDSSNSAITFALQKIDNQYVQNDILSIGKRINNNSIVEINTNFEAYNLITSTSTIYLGFEFIIGKAGSTVTPTYSYTLCYDNALYCDNNKTFTATWDPDVTYPLIFTDGGDTDSDIYPDGPWHEFDQDPVPIHKSVPDSYLYLPGSLYCLNPLNTSLLGSFSNTNGEIRIYQSSNDYKSGIKMIITGGSVGSGFYYSNVSDRLNFSKIGTSQNITSTPSENVTGYIVNTTSANLINFTGQHRVLKNNSAFWQQDNIGKIVVSSGTYCNFDSTNSVSIDESLPIVQLSNTRKQKNVIGVVSSESEEDVRTFAVGAFVSFWPFEFYENGRIVINSIGEGGIWVTNINGNFENGDYITTCEIPGYGMKQEEDSLYNYTVAKITCDCNFDLDSEIYICKEFEWEGEIYRKAFVGCTYHCG